MVVSSGSGFLSALPSGCALTASDAASADGCLVLLVGSGFSFAQGPKVEILPDTVKLFLVPRQERDFALVRVVCSFDGTIPFCDSAFSWKCEMVPRILVKAGLAATRGVGFIQGKPASTAEALAVHLAKTSPTAGVLLADISMEACAMCTMKNQEQVHRQALLAYILRAFHLVQCPVLLLSGPAQAAAWSREGFGVFQGATGFHCAELWPGHVVVLPYCS